MISLKELHDYCFNDLDIQKIAKSIALEFHNKDMSAVVDLPIYMREKFENTDPVNDQALLLRDLVKSKLEKLSLDDLDSMQATNKDLHQWFRRACFFANNYKGSTLDETLLVAYLVMPVIEKHHPCIDAYIDNAENTNPFPDLNLQPDRYGLIKLQDSMELRKHALIMKDKSTMIYPHQFLRRFYRAHFVDMLQILNWCNRKGLQVELRIDPFRRTTPEYYQDIIEMDHWYGKPFSEELLMKGLDAENDDKPTVHYMTPEQKTNNLTYLTYPLEYTTFITNMLEDKQRQFFISEYTLPADAREACNPSYTGVGKKYIIQKFAHFVFDQKKKSVEHIDGAVRYFTHSQYDQIFDDVKRGRNVGARIGDRLKLFKVSGGFDLEILKSILYEFFRYNPLIAEYFTGEPHCNVGFMKRISS